MYDRSGALWKEEIKESGGWGEWGRGRGGEWERGRVGDKHLPNAFSIFLPSAFFPLPDDGITDE
ncbi:MAG: hypothetical protein EAZ49_05805 [Oscillatoriales cyanobacterium]|nr:MAG: hypothetical protein EAZ49_05805 [Oscillatoriales cyanobacterium]